MTPTAKILLAGTGTLGLLWLLSRTSEASPSSTRPPAQPSQPPEPMPGSYVPATFGDLPVGATVTVAFLDGGTSTWSIVARSAPGAEFDPRELPMGMPVVSLVDKGQWRYAAMGVSSPRPAFFGERDVRSRIVVPLVPPTGPGSYRQFAALPAGTKVVVRGKAMFSPVGLYAQPDRSYVILSAAPPAGFAEAMDGWRYVGKDQADPTLSRAFTEAEVVAQSAADAPISSLAGRTVP